MSRGMRKARKCGQRPHHWPHSKAAVVYHINHHIYCYWLSSTINHDKSSYQYCPKLILTPTNKPPVFVCVSSDHQSFLQEEFVLSLSAVLVKPTRCVIGVRFCPAPHPLSPQSCRGHCGQRHWWSSSFQFFSDLFLDDSWIVPDHLNHWVWPLWVCPLNPQPFP